MDPPETTASRDPATRDRLRDRGAQDLARTGLRPEVQRSWTRSELSGVDPDRFAPRYEPDKVVDDSFVTTSAELIGRAFARVEGGPTGVMLTDAHGRIQRSWSGEKSVRGFLSKMGGEPGFVFNEDALGTNGLGTALETAQAVKISGAEHFLTAYAPFTCAAAPVRHPVTRTLLGAVNVARRASDDDGLMLPWAVSVAREIEEELLRRSTRLDRLVLDRFIAASRNTRTAVVCLTERMMISNPAARRIEELGQPFIWEEVSRHAPAGMFSLPNGAVVPMRTDEILDGGQAVGLVIEFDLRSSCSPGSRTPIPTPFVTAGHEPAGPRHADVRRLLVVGGPGAGKATYVQELLATAGAEPGDATWLDCALQQVAGPAWFGPLTERLAQPGANVVLDHVELLEAAAVQTVCALLDQAHTDVRVVATADLSLPPGVQPLVDRLNDGRITVPGLVERREDLPELVRVVTERYASRRPVPIWTFEAIEALRRAPWPGNIRQLESVVHAALRRCESGNVQVHHLPPEILATASSRSLSRLEHLELTEIMRALGTTKGNRTQAAALLEIGRTTLYRRLRYFGIDPDPLFPADRGGPTEAAGPR